MNHVFSISQSRDFGNLVRNSSIDVAPPKLVAPNASAGGAGILGGSNSGTGGVVDVVNNFYWTYSKLIDSRKETPRIILKEKRLKANALISQLKYSFGIAKSNVTAAFESLPDGIKNPITNFLNTGRTGGAVQSASQYTKDLLGQASFMQDNNDVYTQNKYLLPYQNLYITEPTGWEFHLPYFDNYNNSQNNGFSQDAGANPFLGLLKDAVDMATDIAEITNVISNPTQITFVERAKFYNYPTEGEEFSFSFPLINTGSSTFDDVVRNWELVFLLMYNNKPSRKNKSVIEPPVLYQVEIPGVKFLPFCYISAMSVQFKGSRREIKFNLAATESLSVESGTNNPTSQLTSAIDSVFQRVIGFTGQTSRNEISTIIPDAYVINITVKSLIPESKNFMYSVLNKAPVVTTNTAGIPTDSSNNPFVDSTRQNVNASINNPLDTSIRTPNSPNS